MTISTNSTSIPLPAQVSVSDSHLLQALAPERESSSQSVVVFPVHLLDSLTLWERSQVTDLWVEVSHARTGHKVKLPVHIKLIGQKPAVPRESKCVNKY